jgi:hypothetical protein
MPRQSHSKSHLTYLKRKTLANQKINPEQKATATESRNKISKTLNQMQNYRYAWLETLN